MKRKSFLPILSLSVAVSGAACSSYEDTVALKASPAKKDTVVASYKVKDDVFIPSNAFACAAVVSAETKTPVKDGNGQQSDNDKRTGTVTVPTAIFDKAKAELTVGRTVALAGKVGNASNTAGTSFVVTSIAAPVGGKVVISVTFVMPDKAFDAQSLEADINVGTTEDLPAECTAAGEYIVPASGKSSVPGGGVGPDDPAMPRSAEVSRSTDSNATKNGELSPVQPGPNSGGSDLPATTAEDRPLRDAPGLHFEIPPRQLFELEKTFKASNGSSATGTVRGDLLAAYIDVVGRLKVDGKLWEPSVRVGYEAEMEAKVLVGIALKLALANANGEQGPVEFIEDVDAKVHQINVGIGTINLKRRFRIECKGQGTAGLNIKAGAKATGTAFAGAKATLIWPWPVNVKLEPVFDLKVKAEPIFEVATQGEFDGTCSAELRYSLNTWGSADSWIAAKTYVAGDSSPAAKCSLWGGLRGDASVNIPIVPTWNPNIFDLQAGVGGGKCTNQHASDVCSGKSDGNYCDPVDAAHAYRCSGGKLSGQGQYCSDTTKTCKSFDGTGKIVCQ